MEPSATELVNALRALGLDAREGFKGLVNVFFSIDCPRLDCFANSWNISFEYDKVVGRWIYYGPTPERPDWHGKSFKHFDIDYIKSLSHSTGV